MCGGILNSDIKIYNLKLMQEIRKIENHKGTATLSYFLKDNYAITKNSDQLIYWNVKNDWEF